MKTILETDRLLLREFVLDDVEDFFRMVSDPDVTRYTGDGCPTLAEKARSKTTRLDRFGAMTKIDRIIGPYEDRQVVCQGYDPRAIEVAKQVSATIGSCLPGVIVEHFGSTSVLGCAGKGIVDLMLLYPDGKLAAARDVLDALGFQRQTTRDPFPEDRPMRTGSVIYDGTTFLLHIHVIAASSPEAAELRRFRDRLRADPNLVAAYVAAKKAVLASGVTDSVDYCIRKGEFVQQALQAGGVSAENSDKTEEHQRLTAER